MVLSDRLCCVSIHRLQCLSCPRRYFWRYIANLEPKSFNINLWFGKMIHAGVEARLSGKSAAVAKLLMRESDAETCKGSIIADIDTRSEMDIYRSISGPIVEGLYNITVGRAHLVSTEQQFSVPLSNGVTFVGTRDGIGTYDGKSALYEFKTASQITATTFDTIAFNGQVYGYLSSIKAVNRPKLFVYAVLRKPSKWLKRGQSIDDFVKELKADIKARPDFYFAVWSQPVGQHAIDWALADIEVAAEDLRVKYERLPISELQDPRNWPRNDGQCHSYGSCCFIPLCKEAWNWKLKSRIMYRTRDVQYDIELQERKAGK